MEYDEIKAPQPLVQEKHSLEPDMLFGWRPKCNRSKGPIPLKYFDNYVYKQKPEDSTDVYNGPRPVDSYIMHSEYKHSSHYNFNFADPLSSAWAYISKKNMERRPEKRKFIGNSQDSPLLFDSNFENGNLDKVRMQDNDCFDLYVRSDTNSRSPGLWFYFSISNFSPSRKIKLSIVNLAYAYIYEIGMPVCIYSETRKKWVKKQAVFKRSKINSLLLKPAPRPYYSLTFEVEVMENDKLYIASSVPYTCTDLNRFISELDSPHLKHSTLCESLGGVPVPMLTITDRSVSNAHKKYVYITSRLRPIDTASSLIGEGMIRYLISESAASLRKTIVFKIVPLANPDGVVAGNSKTGLAGKDLLRCFRSPKENLFPMPFYFKKRLKKNPSECLYFNIDSNYKKKGSFMFGPYYPIHESNYYISRIIPKILSEKTCIFRYFSCKFSDDEQYMPHGIIHKETGILAYSLQNSIFCYLGENRQTVDFSPVDYFKLGAYLMDSCNEYFLMAQEKKDKEQERFRERVARNRDLIAIQQSIEQLETAKDTEFLVDSDIDKWTDDESFNDDCLLMIEKAMVKSSNIVEDGKYKKKKKNKLQTPFVRHSSNHIKLLKSAPQKRMQKSHNSTVSLRKVQTKVIKQFLPMNRCSFGNDQATQGTRLPELNLKLKKLRNFKGFLKRKANAQSIVDTAQHVSVAFPYQKKHSNSFTGDLISNQRKFGPFQTPNFVKN